MKTNAQSRILVLGGTGSLGYAVTRNFLAAGYHVTLLVRNPAKAEALFGAHPNLRLEPGDAQDLARLRAVSRGHAVIFHGINYPYDQWFGNMDRVTDHVIEAASQEGALIVFPGNVYDYGLVTPIREDSVPRPVSRKGGLRVQLERTLARAAEAGRCRVLNVRLPDFWGPGVANYGTIPMFEGALRGQPLPWAVNADIPHQFVYTPDAAEIIRRLVEAGPGQPYEVVNYGGQVQPTAREFLARISRVAGQAPRVRVYPRLLFTVLAWFQPLMREVKEMLYLWGNSIILDDAAVRRRFPDFRETPLDEAIIATLRWFAEHRLQRQFEPAVAISNQQAAAAAAA
jgi:nucleoside-diphosphate-sugar epimerase